MIPSLLMLQRSVAGLGSLWTSYRVARPAIDLVAGVMSGQPDVFTPGTTPAVTGRLAFHDISWRNILDDVDLDIRPGETVAIVGAGGSGKSTLLRLAARLLEPTSGTITLDGADVATLDLDHLRRRVATLEQHPAVFDRTLRENLALDDRAVPLERVAEVLRATQLDEVIARLPKGLDERLAGGGALSGSERRRLALARVLLLDPDVVLIDELEAGLPQAQAEALLAATRAATAGKTCVLVTHRPDLLATDRVVFLAGGRIVDSGTHEDLAARNDAYRALLSRADREGTG
jgi:ABC-type multidrug transport system fused ATPase/permease subunit